MFAIQALTIPPSTMRDLLNFAAGRGALDAGLSFGRGQPALRILHGMEALQDHPVDLQWRIGRHQPLLDEAREVRDDVARLTLPAGEVLGTLRANSGLGDDADGHLRFASSA